MNHLIQPGTVVGGKYKIVGIIGAGGMGTVYSARELELQRTVALKFLHAELSGDEDSFARFEREAKVLSGLSHPQVLKFLSFGEWTPVGKTNLKIPYIAMEFLEGRSLRQVIDEAGSLPPHRVLFIVSQVCSGMSAAHMLGVVHRDLKPSNFMLLSQPHDDFVKIVDFGLARFVKTPGALSQQLTQTGTLIGSVFYMSPEQCTGGKADSRSDIYALGCIMYEMLTGRPPFDADTPIGLIHKHAHDTPIPVSDLVRDLPNGFDALLSKLMAKLPNHRHQSMSEVLTDINLISSGEGDQVVGVPTDSFVTMRTSAAWALLGIVLLLLGGGVMFLLLRNPGKTVPPVSAVADVSAGGDVIGKDDVTKFEEASARALKRFEMSERFEENPANRARIYLRSLFELERAYRERGDYSGAIDAIRRSRVCDQYLVPNTKIELTLSEVANLRLLREEERSLSKKKHLTNVIESTLKAVDALSVTARNEDATLMCLAAKCGEAVDNNRFGEAENYANEFCSISSPLKFKYGTGRGARLWIEGVLTRLEKLQNKNSSNADAMKQLTMIVRLSNLFTQQNPDIARRGLLQVQQMLYARDAQFRADPALVKSYKSLLTEVSELSRSLQ